MSHQNFVANMKRLLLVICILFQKFNSLRSQTQHLEKYFNHTFKNSALTIESWVHKNITFFKLNQLCCICANEINNVIKIKIYLYSAFLWSNSTLLSNHMAKLSLVHYYHNLRYYIPKIWTNTVQNNQGINTVP